MSLFNTMIRISCISFVAIAILKNFITLNAISDKEFLTLTIATHDNDALLRYKRSAESFKIPYEVLGQGLEWKGGNVKEVAGGGQKVRILKESLEKYKDRNDLIIMFTDSYDVVFQNTSDVILERFKKTNAKVLFSAEGFCWPDTSLESKYPKVGENEKRYLNSGGFIGYAPYLYKIVSYKEIKNDDDDQLYYSLIYLDENLRNEFQMKLDTKSEIFQNLNGAFGEVFLSHDGKIGYLKNVISDSYPVVIHANGPIKVDFNGYTNYLGYSYSPSEGCQHCKEDNIDLQSKQHNQFPKVTMALVVNQPTPFFEEFLEKILKLSYPSKKIDVILYCFEKFHRNSCQKFVVKNKEKYASIKITDNFKNEIEMRNNIIKIAIELQNDFLFIVDSVVHLTNPNVLQSLITKNRSFIGPMVTRREKLWSNFWGALNNAGYYQRSEDYLEIVQNVKRGIWNVPFVNSVYLIKQSVLSQIVNDFGDSSSALESDMTLCENLRNKNIFMWIDNEYDYGYMILSDNFPTEHVNNDLWALFSNPLDWQEKYIHTEYWDAVSAENLMEDLEQPCPDVFWFPLVTEKFCKHIIEDMEAFGQWSDGSNTDSRLEGGYENVPTRDIHMRQVNWEDHWLEFLKTYIYPMQKKVFSGYEDVPWARMNFVVRYRPDEQPTLRPHHDASSYSLNIALNLPGIDFEGGGTKFNRYNCSVRQSRLGWVLMHPGRVTHLHEGLRTTNGTRYIFVTFVNP